ncbi:DUF805 domain-containing protein [Neisseriaceae bacterium ESL0693]|nr:DUF805 domain-containing protein [Neisseriaceae bacterium ESL0693]
MLFLFINCWTKKYLQFSGRASRKELWSFILFSLIFAFILRLILEIGIFYLLVSDPTLFDDPPEEESLASSIGWYWGITIFTLSFKIIILIPQMSLLVRRLHDLDFSGWWVMPYLILVIVHYMYNNNLIIWIILIAIWIKLGRLEGSYGPNRFGDDPLQDNPGN